MVKYFELHHSTEPEEVGIEDGLGQADTSDDFVYRNEWFSHLFSGQYHTLDRWKKWVNLPEYGNDLDGLTLRSKNAKMTDILNSNILLGYIINNKVRDILDKSHLPNHRYFKARFDGVNNNEEYWWFTFQKEDIKEIVDFKNSIFNTSLHESIYNKTIKIESYDQYIALYYESGRAVPAIEIVFNENFNTDLDLWSIQFATPCRGYISESLSHKFIKNNITGFKLKEPKCKLIF